MKFDAVVIGAGPGGSAAAYQIAKAGLKVLMVEKRAEVGSPKRCAEGLSFSSMERMGIKVPDNCVARKISGATVYAPNGKSVRADFKKAVGCVLERKVFDKWLAYEASRVGAKVLAKTEAVSLERVDGGIKVSLKSDEKGWDAEAKIVIAADGVESKMARMMGFDTTNKLADIASGYQVEMSNVKIDPDRTELYFGNEIAGGGYCWIFPKGVDVANVGIGVRKPWAKKTAKEHLMDFIQSKPGLKKGSIIEVNAGGVPVGGIMDNMVEDNFMVVGDAGHQVNPIHGGGIADSYIGGKIAGLVAVEAVKSGDLSKKKLSEYNRRWLSFRGNKLKKLVKLRMVVESLSDDELNWLVDYLKGEDLVELSNAGGFKKLGWLLMKKPRLLSIARKLM